MLKGLVIGIVLAVPFALLAGCGSNTPEAPDNNGAAGSAGAQQEAGTDPVDASTADAEPDSTTDQPDAEQGADGPSEPSYPAGPFGYAKGALIQNYQFLGWKDPKANNYQGDLESIKLSDYYDPDGTKGIRALFINASARWCSVCKSEQADIRQVKATWEPKGVRFLETLFEDETQDLPEVVDLNYWAKRYQIDWALVLDPANKLGVFFDATATPMNMVVDTKTMKITAIVTGLPSSSWYQQQFGALTQ